MFLSCPKFSMAPTSLRVKAKSLQRPFPQPPAHLSDSESCFWLHPPHSFSPTRHIPASGLLLTTWEEAQPRAPLYFNQGLGAAFYLHLGASAHTHLELRMEQAWMPICCCYCLYLKAGLRRECLQLQQQGLEVDLAFT